MVYQNSLSFAQKLDKKDPLREFRRQFHIPKFKDQDVIYLCGNSLGLQPKIAKDLINEELQSWSELGVEGHFKEKNPWYGYHHLAKPALSKLTGGTAEEVLACNSLTTNLHLLMVTFYQPTKNRYKIMIEAGAFPSDQYAVESQLNYHGFSTDQALIRLEPRTGESTLRTKDIISLIEENGPNLALVLLGGVQYYTGQLFDIPGITKAGKKAGAYVGFDLAHAIGNVPLHLHEWGVDFAVWCSYKYLNSGPGGVGGMFIHSKHGKNQKLKRFAGWWGHHEEERFLMKKGFQAIPSVDGWQLSNANVLSLASHQAALEIFSKARISRLREKSIQLTGFMEFLLEQFDESENKPEILTPKDPQQRGCQLSLSFNRGGKQIFEHMERSGIIADWREPNVIRVAPVPLYNSFEDVYKFTHILRNCI